jgi:hypothetical protein
MDGCAVAVLQVRDGGAGKMLGMHIFSANYPKNRHPRGGGGVISRNSRNDEPGTGPYHVCRIGKACVVWVLAFARMTWWWR